MSASNLHVRATILNALEEVDATEGVKPPLLRAFVDGLEDIPFDELALDSVQRMELLVALELEHDVVIAPAEFALFRSLGDIALHVDSPSEAKAAPIVKQATDTPPITDNEPAPFVVRLFQRTFHTCRTVAHFNMALDSFAHRLTPLDVETLRDWHQRSALFPPATDQKYETALTDWLTRIDRLMRGNGTTEPEPFRSNRLAPAVVHFSGPGDRSNKTLLICFAIHRSRHLFIPNCVLLQHIDAAKYDVMIVADIGATAFRTGVPHMGNSVVDVVDWIASHELLPEYAALRTFGCSAGGYPAMLTARRVQSELCVSVSGRFPSERHAGQIISMLYNNWRYARRNKNARVLIAYGETKRRDKKYARRLARITGANRLSVEMPNHDVGHNLLEPITEHGELAHFLERTLFAEIDDGLFAGKGELTIMRFPIA